MAATLSPDSQSLLLKAGTPLNLARTDYKQAAAPPHLLLLNRIMLDVAAGTEPRVLVSMPPRHGKSFLCSRYFPAWFLMHNPDKRVILASYEAEYAAEWGDQVREVIKRQGSICGVRVRDDRSARNNWQIEHHGGGMVTAGAGGPITGRGADLFVIDDPFKNSAEALSETVRKRVWDWYISTAYTRLEPGGRMVIIQTRWHEDDLIGKAQAQGGWKYINLEALCETQPDPVGRANGEALWPERYDEAELCSIRDNDEHGYWWAAMYQGRPAPLEGGMFKRAWFRYAERNGSPSLLKCGDEWRNVEHATKFLTVDLAASTKTTGDYTVIAAWASFKNGPLVLLDVIRERLEGPDIVPQIALAVNRHGAGVAYIERIGFQTALLQEARRQGVPVRELNPDKDKVTRAAPAAALFADSRMYFAPGEWRGALEHELLSFPNAAHDDQVDVVSYGARVHNEMQSMTMKRSALR